MRASIRVIASPLASILGRVGLVPATMDAIMMMARRRVPPQVQPAPRSRGARRRGRRRMTMHAARGRGVDVSSRCWVTMGGMVWLHVVLCLPVVLLCLPMSVSVSVLRRRWVRAGGVVLVVVEHEDGLGGG